MTADVLLLVAGTVLIAVAAVAGSARARAIGRAGLGATPRAAVAGAGLLCIVAGLILIPGDGTGARAKTGTVHATIAAELSPDEVSEEIRVFLDGRDVGIVRVDEQTPKSRMAVTVTGEGRHDYRLKSTQQVKGRPPTRATRRDDVVIEDGAELGILYGPDGDVYLADLN